VTSQADESWLNRAFDRARGLEPEEEPVAEPTGADFDAGVRESAPPPPPSMNDHLRAAIRAARRQPVAEDYDQRLR
jgi:hypothetical protein